MKTMHITLAKQYRKLALYPSVLANYVSNKFNNSPRRVMYYARSYHYHLNGSVKVHNSTLRIIIFLTLTFCYSTFLSGRVAVAESTTFTINNNNTVLELTVPSTVNLNLNPTSGSAFGTTNLTISTGTNHPYGYILTMTVPNTNLTNSDLTMTSNPNNITLDGSNHPIIPTLSTGSYTEDTFTTNTWGYKLSTASHYGPMPSSLELINTDTRSNQELTTLNLAAKIDTTRPAGTYTTTFNFATVTNPIVTNYTITYNDASGAGTGLPADQTSTITADTGINLSSTEPTRTDYNFIGWCTVDNSANSNACSGTTYNAGDTFTVVNTGSDITIPLYAIWELDGEIWHFNETIPYAGYLYGDNYFNVNFISDGVECNRMHIYYSASDGALLYYYGESYYTNAYWSSDLTASSGNFWYKEAYRTIIIKGGSDANNPNFRAWLQINATQL